MADWASLKRFLRLRRAGVPARVAQRVLAPKAGTFVVEAEIHRAEEMRADLLGVPAEDEVRKDLPHDPWRPARSLGKLPRP
jgi:hypothetical protein